MSGESAPPPPPPPSVAVMPAAGMVLDPAAALRHTTSLQQVQMQKATRANFNFEPFLQKEYAFGLFPDRGTCEYWAASTSNTPYGSHYKHDEGKCPLGADCPLKHPSKIFKNKIVCKYWLRGLCKMGPNCDFLHEYNLSKMPECATYAQTGVCPQAGECIYLHMDQRTKVAECPDFQEIGFCPDGPKCGKRHIRRVLCEAYLTGFCPKGPQCENAHPKFSVVRSRQGRFKIMTDTDIIKARIERLVAEGHKPVALEQAAKQKAEKLTNPTPSQGASGASVTKPAAKPASGTRPKLPAGPRGSTPSV